MHSRAVILCFCIYHYKGGSHGRQGRPCVLARAVSVAAMTLSSIRRVGRGKSGCAAFFADEAVVCSGTELSTCTLQVTVGAQETIDDGQSFGLLLEDQDGAATCGKLTEEQWDAVVLPHQSSWSGASYLTELTYSTQLPTESRKLCIVAVSANIKTFGTP